MLNKLRYTLKRWLHIDLEVSKRRQEIARLEKRLKKLEDTQKSNLDMVTNISRLAIEAAQKTTAKSEKLNATGENLIKQFNLSIDANVYGKSWAVFSVNGKQTLVHFAELPHDDLQFIERFLQRFAGTNRAVDAPRGIKPLQF